jgi:hypothetical protein
VSELAGLVAGVLAPFTGPFQEDEVFGTTAPDAVAAALLTAAPDDVEEAFAYHTSIGCVAGLVLVDGRRVAVKAHPPRYRHDLLAAVVAVQGRLAGTGYPCPRPLGAPRACGRGWATVETWCDDPGPRPWRVDDAARGLAALTTAATAVAAEHDREALRRQPLRARPGVRFPDPHHPLFAPAWSDPAGAWIDAIADAAAHDLHADPGDEAVGHGDWCTRNVRWDGDAPAIVYDWSSLTLEPESWMAGVAASHWPLTGEPGSPRPPTSDEWDEFLDAYAAACRRPWRAGSLAAARAAALTSLAYTARCELAAARALGKAAVGSAARDRLAAHR